MRPIPGLHRLFRFPFGRHQVERDVDDELRFHLAMRVDELVEEGMTPEGARAEAQRRFGDLEQVRRSCLDLGERSDKTMRRRNFVAEIRQDLLYACRSLAKAPGFTAVALLTLALALGATTAIYSVVDGILLQPLPYPEPQRLVAAWADLSERGGPQREWLSYPNFHDLKSTPGVFEELAIYGGWGPTLTGLGDAEQLTAAQVSHGMFSRVLAVEPQVGRGFAAEEDRPGGPRVVLLSNAFWRRELGADRAAIGTTLSLDDQPYTIVGVMPPGFTPPFFPRADLWAPIQQSVSEHFGGRGSAIFRAVGRLAPGVSLSAAESAASTLGERLAEEYPQANTGVGYYLAPLRGDLASATEPALWTLLGAVVFVLLIACFNVANLLLARAASRQVELSVRAALGAGRGRIARQLLTESALLALGGGLLAVVLAHFLTGWLVSMAPPGTPRLTEVAVDGRILAFTAAATLGSVLLFGLTPIFHAVRGDLQGVLRSRGSGDRGGTLRRALVAVQVAVVLVLLAGSGLLLRSFEQLRQVETGFDAEGRLTFALNLPRERYPERADRRQAIAGLEERLAALPGVVRVGAISPLPLSGNDGDVNFQIEGRPEPPAGQEDIVWFRRATPGYFEALGLELVEGRAFTESDSAEGAPVVIVNQTLAERYFPGQSALGRRINVNNPSQPVWRRIVGVARDVKNFGLDSGSRNALYAPFTQAPTSFMALVVQTPGEPLALAPAVRAAVAELDPALAVTALAPMEEVVRESLGPQRFVLNLVAGFALLGLLLAAVGIYGLVAYGVRRRVREMGVRIALGARGGDIGRLVLRGSLVPVWLGVGLGLLGAWWLTRLMGGLLFGVRPGDPLTLLAVSLLLVAVAVVASLVPARRAAAVDPVTVLKAE